jgi:hypothetical protein
MVGSGDDAHCRRRGVTTTKPESRGRQVRQRQRGDEHEGRAKSPNAATAAANAEAEEILRLRRADDLDAEFEREALIDDDSEARRILASGRPIHIARDDTPDGHVVRVHPDGSEEIVRVDWEEAARILGG